MGSLRRPYLPKPKTEARGRLAQWKTALYCGRSSYGDLHCGASATVPFGGELYKNTLGQAIPTLYYKL